jgi:DNA (cytosine-5)-methyltransferase 1
LNEPYRVLDLFSGVGGFSLGLERTGGFRTVAFCEIEPYCRAVLRKHWPDVPCYEDVRTLTAERLAADGISVDVICGGFPCQDISVAGKRAGIGGERSGLWGELARLIGELRPDFALVENVANLLAGPSEQPGGWFGRVLGDLAEIGYDAEWHSIPASAVGALHYRGRIWIVAYPHAYSLRPQRVRQIEARAWPEQQFARLVQDQLRISVPAGKSGGVVDGVRHRSHRLRALGNAVVPQIPEIIGRAILQAEGRLT